MELKPKLGKLIFGAANLRASEIQLYYHFSDMDYDERIYD